MFKILCLTTGSEIRWPKIYYRVGTKLLPGEIQDEMILEPGKVILFNTEEAASWFVRRRLSYNPKRTDSDKLSFMNDVFRASDMSEIHMSAKHMFDIIEV